MNRHLYYGIFLAALIFGRQAFASDAAVKAPVSVLELLQDQTSKITEGLGKMEWHYIHMSWGFKKYREMIYGPLWDAIQERADAFSINRKSEGDVLYSRYAELSEADKKSAHEERDALNETFEKIKTDISEINGFCDAMAYQNCFANWHDRVQIRLKETDALLKKIYRAEDDLNSRVESTISDSPSDHDDLGKRISEMRDIWETDFDRKIILALQGLREELELRLPAESCAATCTEETIGRSKHSQWL